MQIASWRGLTLTIMCLAFALATPGCGNGNGDDGKDASPVITPSSVSATPSRLIQTDIGGALQDPHGSALVDVPANALVKPQGVSVFTGDWSEEAPVGGKATTTLQTHDLAADPSALAQGSYEAIELVEGAQPMFGLVEIFGAITFEFKQGDQLLQLAKAKKAAVRIPVHTRSSERPPTLALYYWSPYRSGWVHDGSATLQSDPITHQQYYEGQASRAGTWAAAKLIEDLVTIQGCVQLAPGYDAPPGLIHVHTEGLNYSSLIRSGNLKGQFKVRAKRGSKVMLRRTGWGGPEAVDLGLVNADVVLPECFVMNVDVTAFVEDDFDTLFATFTQAADLALRAARMAVSADGRHVLAPAAVCNSGSVDGLSLNGQAASGGEPLSRRDTYTLTGIFSQCKQANGDDRITGQSTATFAYQEDGEFLTLDAAVTLNGFQDGNTRLSGAFTLAHGKASANDVLLLTPQPGAELQSLHAARTITFTSGSLLVTREAIDNAEAEYHAYRQLAYALNGHQYVLNGSLKELGDSITLTRDEALIASITLTREGPVISGRVDPF